MSDNIVWLNGNWLPYPEAHIAIEDRGFLLADGVYEVVRYYSGRGFKLDRHMARLARSCAALEISLPYREADLASLTNEIVARNRLSDGTVYIQITRGAGPRVHHFPGDIPPTTLMLANAINPLPAAYWTEGVACISVPDERWARCYIKSISLLPNVLAKEQARRGGCYEAIFIRDGFLTEGSSSNILCVRNGVLITPPLTNYILPGISRAMALEVAADLSIPVRLEAVSLNDLRHCDEIMVASTRAEVLPVVRLDGQPVGNGKPGPIQARLYEGFQRLTHS